MASQTHEIAFKLAGQISGSFSKTFSAASSTLAKYNKNMLAVNQQAGKMDKVIRLRQETGEAARAYYQAKQKVAELGREISATDNPSKQMIANFEKAKAATTKAKTALDKKRAALKEVESASGTAGTSLQTLIQRQKQLKLSAEQAAAAQEKMAKATELQGKLKGMAGSSAMALGGMAAAAAPVALTVKAAMDFEDMQAELGKFSDDAENIFSGIKKLTGKYSKSATDMTAMATNAMQSGIAKTKEDVLELVESQTQAAVAFGMTGDAVGSAWADIQSKMQTSVSETKDVFDIVNKLGNETSASSEDILNVLQRQGGTVKSLTALNEKQIAAMAGAFRSASTSSEVAATSMGTFFSRLTVGSTATKAQQKAFEALGLDAEDLAKRMTSSGESAQNAVQDVFARINKLSPDKRGAIIGQLFGNEAGIKAAVATLSANANMLGNNIKMVGDKTNYSGSMFKEYSARANTTSEALGIAKNQLTLIAANLGQALLPTVKSATKSFIEIANKVANFVEKNQTLIFNIMKIAGIVYGAVAAFHVFRIALFAVASPVLQLYKGFQLYKATLAAANAATATGTKLTLGQKVAMLAHAAATKVVAGAQKVWAAAQWALNTAILGCPVMWIVAGIAAIVAAGVLLYKNWDKIKAGAIALWNKAVNCFNSIKSKVIELWKIFQQKFPMLARIVQIATLPIQVAIQAVIIVFKLLKAAGIALWNGIKWCWNGIKSATVSAWNAIQQPLMNAWNKFKAFAGYIKSGFVSAFQGIRSKVASVFSGLIGIIKRPMNAVISLVNKAIGGINKINVKIPKWAGGGSIGFNIAKIPQLAQGGIATKATPAIIGEGREPEAVLPLSKLNEMLRNRVSGGMASGGGNITVHFEPVINITGGGNGNITQQVQQGLNSGVRNLRQELEKIKRNEMRLGYA